MEHVLSVLKSWKLQAATSVSRGLTTDAILRWAPVQYVMNLDGNTRLAIILAATLCIYISLTSFWRLTKVMLSSTIIFVQLAFFVILAVCCLQYKDFIVAFSKSISSKLDL